MNKKVLVLIARGFEEIEALSCVDILRRASIEAITVGVGGKEITGAHGVKIECDRDIENVSTKFDALVLPGGQPGADNLASSEKVKSLIREYNSAGKIIAAICASPAVVLAPAGVLEGKKATCYPGMEKNFSKNTRYRKKEVVVDENIITSRGPATAMNFALRIVRELLDRQSSKKLAGALLYK